MKRHVTSLEELADEFDVVCNCSGLGAGVLAGDRDVLPVRGQIFQVRHGWALPLGSRLLSRMYPWEVESDV